MSSIWLVIVLLAISSMALKMSGVFLIGNRGLPKWALPVIDVLPGALLSALIVVQVVGGRNEIVIDERLIGLLVASGVLYRRRKAMIAALVAAAAATALARAVL